MELFSIRIQRTFQLVSTAQTRKLLTNFSKNSFYLLPEPLRLGEFLTNYCLFIPLLIFYADTRNRSKVVLYD